MFIIITPNKVYMDKTLKGLNHKIGGTMDFDEFVSIGGDMVSNLAMSDIDFVQDKRKLSAIMFGNFFKKDTLPRTLSIINLIVTFICLVQIMGLG